MWALIGPGLADPAHIELRSRTIYLDSDALLGTRDELLAGTLERRRVLACLGAGLHEVMHAKHTKRWVADHDPSSASPTTPASGSSRSTARCSRSRAWRPTAAATSRPTAPRALRARRADRRRRRRDRARFAAQLARGALTGGR